MARCYSHFTSNIRPHCPKAPMKIVPRGRRGYIHQGSINPTCRPAPLSSTGAVTIATVMTDQSSLSLRAVSLSWNVSVRVFQATAEVEAGAAGSHVCEVARSSMITAGVWRTSWPGCFQRVYLPVCYKWSEVHRWALPKITRRL